MNIPQKIAKNTIVLLVSQIITYVLNFLFTLYSARYLGVEGFGVLSYALAFIGLFSILMDLGLSTLTTRDVAREKKLTNKYISNVILLKTILVIITFSLIGISINLLNYPQQTINVVYIISLSFILANFALIFTSIFQAHEIMEYQSLANILGSLILFLGALYIISKGFGVIGFATLYLINSIIVLFYNLIVYYWKIGSLKFDFDLKFWKYIIKEALPLSISLIFTTIAFKIDTVMLSLIINNMAVGLYTAPYKLMEALLFIPNVFSIVALPVFSKLHTSSKNSLKFAYQKSFKYLFILGIPISVGTTLLANEFILLIYGSGFSESILAFQILIWAIPFIFLRYISKIILVSINKQDILLKIIFFSMILNIILNLVLIPQYSFIGASVVTVITEFTSFLLCFYVLSKYLVRIEVIKIIIKPIIASMVMAFFILYVKTNIFILVSFSIIIYFISILLLKTLDKEDIKLFMKITERKN